ncbi:helix-turn-helix domain-containing protein [Deinococcus planocerae]|uniref:helix-turn-helix domain-containing protein n=1 Tax=Deinococcus planocerae TaxID=1737569 RepID=UPI000C7F3F2E|nr:helix-turn-helix domain-containing protein [Deinococcus planocerae]
MALVPTPQTVFTLAEVAAVLRVTPETIRRRIVAGELSAVEVGGRERKQYRITANDLARWLGSERAAQLFGIGAGLLALERAFAERGEEEVEAAIAEAVEAVRQRRSPAGEVLPPPTAAEIRKRFPDS